MALARLPADGDRAGAILLNPGGPGASGLDFLSAIAVYARDEMGLDRFDLVSFDPRGVDRSAGIRCLSDEELDAVVFLDPDADSGLDADTEFVEGCLDRYGDALRHFSTVSTAHDMDLMREAMGDETLSYLGISYGTYLGTVYATLYPERVQAFVLDSAFEPTGDSVEEQYLTQLVGFEQAFDAWAADCQSSPACPFGAGDVAAAWDELRVELAVRPVPSADGRVANRSVLETATIAALYSPVSWPLLSLALTDVTAGDPSGLFLLADEYVGRRSDGTFSTITQSNTVISCASGFTRDTPDDPAAFVEVLQAAAPRFASDVTVDDFGDDCTDLVPPVTLPALGHDGDGRFIVVGGVNDPATPIRWAEEMAETLGPNARLVTWNGEGHGQLLFSRCLKDLAARLFVDGQLPDDRTVCDPDPDVEPPDWWADLPVVEGLSDPLPDGTLASIGVPPSLAYGEARTTTLDADQVRDAYRTGLTADGFSFLTTSEEFAGVITDIYMAPGDGFSVLSVLVVTEAALDDPEFATIGRLLGDGELLVALLYLPI